MYIYIYTYIYMLKVKLSTCMGARRSDLLGLGGLGLGNVACARVSTHVCSLKLIWSKKVHI